MPEFFPQHTITMSIEEPKAFRRFSRSLVEMALITGLLIALAQAHILFPKPIIDPTQQPQKPPRPTRR